FEIGLGQALLGARRRAEPVIAVKGAGVMDDERFGRGHFVVSFSDRFRHRLVFDALGLVEPLNHCALFFSLFFGWLFFRFLVVCARMLRHRFGEAFEVIVKWTLVLCSNELTLFGWQCI